MADIQHGATATDLADPALDDDGSSTLPGVHPWLIIGGVIVMVTVLATISSVLFNSTLRREPVTGTIGPSQVDDGVRVDGTVTNVDLTKNVMTLRITLDPTGSFDTNDSNIPSRPITMYYTGADGTKKVAFEAGKPIGATDLTLSLKEADDLIVPQVAPPSRAATPGTPTSPRWTCCSSHRALAHRRAGRALDRRPPAPRTPWCPPTSSSTRRCRPSASSRPSRR